MISPRMFFKNVHSILRTSNDGPRSIPRVVLLLLPVTVSINQNYLQILVLVKKRWTTTIYNTGIAINVSASWKVSSNYDMKSPAFYPERPPCPRSSLGGFGRRASDLPASTRPRANKWGIKISPRHDL